MDLKKIVIDSVQNMLKNTTSPKKIQIIKDKHNTKVHFVPYKYRVLGGILQSLNIQFGNFIEILIQRIISEQKNLSLLKECNNKSIKLSIADNTDNIIDKYITSCQHSYDANNSEINFKILLNEIFKSEINNPSNNKNVISHDIDMLFKHNDTIYYLEFKYTDDHDTGKIVDINRKFLKTYAGLISYLNITNINDLYPYIYYFNNITKRPNQFVYEGSNILRGASFFNKFLDVSYNELDLILKEISSDESIVKFFDDLYGDIRHE